MNLAAAVSVLAVAGAQIPGIGDEPPAATSRAPRCRRASGANCGASRCCTAGLGSVRAVHRRLRISQSAVRERLRFARRLRRLGGADRVNCRRG